MLPPFLAQRQYPISVPTGTWLDAGMYRDDSGAWLTIKAAIARHRLPRKSLERWVNAPCRFLTDADGNRRARFGTNG